MIARLAAGLACASCVLWNADLPGWFGVAFLKEQYLAVILGLSLCATYLTTRWTGEETERTPWYDLAVALAANRYGSSRLASYQAGVAVSATSTAVYVATAAPAV